MVVVSLYAGPLNLEESLSGCVGPPAMRRYLTWAGMTTEGKSFSDCRGLVCAGDEASWS